MTFFAVLAALAAWWGATRSDTHGVLKMIQLPKFGAPGLVLLLFGGFGYWWDTNGYAYPAHRSLTLPVCGALILVAEFVLMARSDAN